MLWSQLITLLKSAFDNCSIEYAGQILRDGGLVAFPTETVYGLGANALDPDAVKKIYDAKSRPSDNPLIVHVDDIEWLDKLAVNVSDTTYKLANAFWPGPLTIIMEKSTLVPLETSGGLHTVGIRIPKNDAARKLIRSARVPISAPSANTSGNPSPTKAAHVYQDLNGKIPLILDGGSCQMGIESTIIDVTAQIPCILRPGSVTKEMLQAEIGHVEIDKNILEDTYLQSAPKAPGMKYKHYAPKAKVTVFVGDELCVSNTINKVASTKDDVKIGILATDQTKKFYSNENFFVLSLGDRNNLNSVASKLFDALRQFDDKEIEQVYAEGFNETELGLSIMNRLKKSAGYDVIKC